MTTENLVAPFNQMNVMNGRLNAAAATGACHTFSIAWCARIRKDPATVTGVDRMTAMRVQGGGSSPVLQKTYVDRTLQNPLDYMVSDAVVLMTHGMKNGSVPVAYGYFRKADQKTYVDKIKAPESECMIYNFQWAAGTVTGSHTIAFFRKLRTGGGAVRPDNRFIHAFDANFGEYEVQDIQFNYWYNKWQATYGKITTHYLKHIVPV